MKKICAVVGARPQFIKLSVISRVIKNQFNLILVHTGQHYDYNMSEVFFKEMDIPYPDYNLGISGGSHSIMTGKMMMALEEVFIKEEPDLVLLFGDTNSTLAAALTAVKLHFPVCHVESGNRFKTLDSPEEVNRIVTDHISSINLPCTESSLFCLKQEGLGETATMVGDPMYDAYLYYVKRLDGSELEGIESINNKVFKLPEEYYYLTCHRQENTESDDNLSEIIKAAESLDSPTIYPVHPRNQEQALRIVDNLGCSNIILTKPVGYKTSISLINNSKKVITDSGGVQREAFFAKKQCVTVLDFVVWPETMYNKCNQLAKPEATDILLKLRDTVHFDPSYKPFGNGHSAEKIVDIIKEYIG